MDPAKLKVVELRAELTKRGLDPKGNKPVLVERLRVALEEENPSQTQTKSTLDSENSSDNDSKSVDETKPIPKTPSRSSRHSSREPVTPVRSSRRRSNSRSSVTASESNDAVQSLEPIVEDPKSEEKLETPKKEKSLQDEQKTSPVKETNESCKSKLEFTEKAEKHVEDEPQKIIKKIADNNKTPEKSIHESPKKISTPEKTVCDSPNKISTPDKVIESPKKISSPVKAIHESPKKIVTTEQNVCESPKKISTPEKSFEKLPDKMMSPEKGSNKLPEKTLSPEKSQICKTPEKMVNTPDKSEIVKSPIQTPDKKITPSTENETKIVESPDKIKNESKPISDSSNLLKSPSPVKSLKLEDHETSENLNEEMKDKVPEEEMQDEPMEQCIEEQEENSSPTKPSNEESPRNRDHKRLERKDDRKRRRSHSPHEEHNSTTPKPEDEPEINSSDVLLSWFDSDLNLKINKKDFISAEPMEGEGFSYMWAGARASYGFTKDKVFYEAKINKLHSVHSQENESPNVLRLGWSVQDTSMQLGEEELSFCFSSIGKKSVNKEFSDYGSTFAVDDIVSCYADFTSEMNVTLSYAINGENKGIAFEIPKETLNDKALFPHILSKNCSFTVNFGQEDKWSSDTTDDFTFVGKINKEDRISGPQRAEKREDCHVILLCGLPASGKTAWAEKYQSENKDKYYNLLGISNIINRMNVLGVSIKEVFKGRYESLLENASRSLNKLLDLAPTRRRNYIIDQSSNIYASAQRRKMRSFNGFQRKAIVIVPSDEEFKELIKKRKESDENFQESSILEMKAGFCAPVVGESFESVEYVVLEEEEAKKVIENYNEEGKTAGYGPNQPHHKRHRYDSKDRNNRDKRSGYNDRNRNSPWRGSSGGGGWRDRNQRGGPMRHGGAPYSPSGWRGNRTGGSDRRSGNDRSRSASSRSGWNSGYQGSHHSYNQSSNWQGSQGWGGNNYPQGYSSGGSWKGYSQNYPSSGYSSGYGNGNYGYQNQSYYNNPYYNQSSGKSSSNSSNKK